MTNNSSGLKKVSVLEVALDTEISGLTLNKSRQDVFKCVCLCMYIHILHWMLDTK